MDGNKAYTIVQVISIDSEINADVKQAANDEFQAAVAAEYMSAYGKSLKAKSDVVVNRKLLQTNLDN
jgi:peptidyl-prolyl cis-trans isomerase D